MLHFLLGYLAGAGIEARWVVLEGTEDFFEVTKRLHHLLHGRPGDGRGLDQTVRGIARTLFHELLHALFLTEFPGEGTGHLDGNYETHHLDGSITYR